jgi:hypothetical protein
MGHRLDLPFCISTSLRVSETTRVIPLRFALRYSHSMQVIDKRDLDALASMIGAPIADQSWRS